ncbi:uncharacterized protein LOC129613506 [Condylostylus longicornis]|uniref:uncharacterized protein LOC129613506 n=1 Tax=Condylostylus longicornis TaxID=2530218 RepID=UPI00244DE7C3|nr:uncharacterized protein LOC129613506 [Condylostylus longicornis]
MKKMKSNSTKKQERLEKKKKKLAALAEVMKLNDKDRQEIESSKNSISNSDDEVPADKDKVSKRNEPADHIEPKKKKVKLEENSKIPEESEKIEESENKSNDMKNDNSNLGNNDTEISDEQYITIKKSINKRKHAPQFRLKEFGEFALLSVDHDCRTPIFLTDIQHLLMGSLINLDIGCIPNRWCTVEKLGKLSHTVVLIVEGISLFHYLSYQNQFEETNKIFENKLEVILPTFEEGKVLKELATVPLTAFQKDQLIEKYGSIEAAIEMNKDPIFMVKEVFPIENTEISEKIEIENKLERVSKEVEDKFPRTKLLLSALQMVEEGYPLPLRGELERRYKSYKFTKNIYENVTSTSPLFGVDCEMCRTSAGNELTRISIVDENMELVYESLVRPKNVIIDYLTKYSGITAEMMMNVTKQLHQVQEDVIKLLPSDAILVGQSLNSDLHAMKMMHPYVIDTSVIFNLTGDRKRKSKLQVLAKEFLGEVIQKRIEGHDSIEDSKASLKLTKLKLLNSLDYGDIVLMRKKEQNKAKKLGEMNISNNFFAYVSKVEKRATIISAKEIPSELKNELDGHYKINSDDTETHPLQNKVHYYVTDGNKAAISKAKEVVYDNSLTICNVNIAPQQLELSKVEKTMENIDKWIRKIHECVSSNGLFIVIIGGSPGSTSGVAMIKIKKHVIESNSETSITA